ncbi:IS607 family transposase [Mycobacterium shinjukuense]|uniref:IS607 family transposase n=1 Tax=Mycobacterium shinjukuense TaxID=398694 RepID=UPI0013D17801|nr:IS607 family transposase [Mycobacterium shinjukuense]
MNLADWAASVGVNRHTAYRWFREGALPVPAERVGRLILVRTTPAGDAAAGGVVIYARVSSHDQRADLDRQVARLRAWATEQDLTVGLGVPPACGGVVTEVGSGLNGKRPKLRRMLSDPDAKVIVVEHRDRLARFGVEHLEAVLAAQGRRIVVADPGETTDDLVRDMIEVLTSMCARLYGRRGARNRAMRALAAAKRNPGEVA